jgi:NADPH:quinone reductase
MREPRNQVVQVRRFGGPDELEMVDAPLPTAGRGEVRVRVLASMELTLFGGHLST